MNNLAQDENIPLPAVSKDTREVDLAPKESVTALEEQRLISSCQNGNLDAFDQLILKYQDQVFGLAFQMLHDRDDAEDIAQEVFLSCYRNIQSFRFESRFSTWLYRITVNLVKNRWKHQKRRQADRHISLDAPLSPDDPRPMDIADPHGDPRQEAEGRQALELLTEAMAALPLEYQEVLTLRFVQNLQYEEIAEVLNCSLGTVKSRINRARSQLREQLGEALD